MQPFDYISIYQIIFWSSQASKKAKQKAGIDNAVNWLYDAIEQPITDAIIDAYTDGLGQEDGRKMCPELSDMIEQAFSGRDRFAQSLAEAALTETVTRMEQLQEVIQQHINLICEHIYQAYVLGQRDQFKNNGFSQYQYVSELWENTCVNCKALHGRVFKLEDASPGANFPQIHPNCRCSIRPYQTEQKAQMNIPWLAVPVEILLPGNWEREQKWLANPFDFSNFINFMLWGVPETIEGAVHPKKPLSFQHWADSFSTVLLMLPVLKHGANQVTPTVVYIQKQAVGHMNSRPQLHIWEIDDERVSWPPNDGFEGTPQTIILEPGTKIDRYGPPGRYFSPIGTKFHKRALPSAKRGDPYNIFEVLEPFEVKAGKIAKWYGQPGGGIQYFSEFNAQQLIDMGIIKEVLK